jgi:hypothetical protein
MMTLTYAWLLQPGIIYSIMGDDNSVHKKWGEKMCAKIGYNCLKLRHTILVSKWYRKDQGHSLHLYFWSWSHNHGVVLCRYMSMCRQRWRNLHLFFSSSSQHLVSKLFNWDTCWWS